ncbi:GntR family transcriptional regulator [Rhodococcus sp. JS3073]|uniref:GntR family transcriptional regulator n=1 Tax=Rhodococcus sp. JS3073 TaxID=3002901 RepID=UPI0022860359|nr:GntR family transcriptional regulator [Rhodococcus sp. JS3073]WAM14718.1 GntR family transcriptional regulator [Rhodococcus sp. JS3073]
MLQPGEKLSVYSLADELGVSRVPLREAVRQLEAESHVDNVPRRGPHSGAIRGLARPRNVERRRAEGLSRKDVLGCLKRFIPREVYHDLRHDLTAATPDRTSMPMAG